MMDLIIDAIAPGFPTKSFSAEVLKPDFLVAPAAFFAFAVLEPLFSARFAAAAINSGAMVSFILFGNWAISFCKKLGRCLNVFCNCRSPLVRSDSKSSYAVGTPLTRS